MTKKLQKRDNRYYLERLRCDHPSIYVDYQAGKYPSAAAAFIAAGLRKQRSQLDQLELAWAKASQSERDAFKTFIGCVAANSMNSAPVTGTASPSGIPFPAPTTAGVGVALHIDGYLSADTVAHLKKVMSHRNMKMGDLMVELGFKKLTPSLGLAINQGSRVKDQHLIDALEDWLKKNPL